MAADFCASAYSESKEDSALFWSHALQTTSFAWIASFISWFHNRVISCHYLLQWSMSIHIPEQQMKLHLLWTASTPSQHLLYIPEAFETRTKHWRSFLHICAWVPPTLMGTTKWMTVASVQWDKSNQLYNIHISKEKIKVINAVFTAKAAIWPSAQASRNGCPQTIRDILERSTKTEYEQFVHAKYVWNPFYMGNVGEYHDLCLKSDMLLAANVSDSFRNTCMQYNKLDPDHFLHQVPVPALGASI